MTLLVVKAVQYLKQVFYFLSFSVMKCPSLTIMTKIRGWLNSWKIFYFFAVQNVMRNAEQKIFFYNMPFAITQM